MQKNQIKELQTIAFRTVISLLYLTESLTAKNLSSDSTTTVKILWSLLKTVNYSCLALMKPNNIYLFIVPASTSFFSFVNYSVSN